MIVICILPFGIEKQELNKRQKEEAIVSFHMKSCHDILQFSISLLCVMYDDDAGDYFVYMYQ